MIEDEIMEDISDWAMECAAISEFSDWAMEGAKKIIKTSEKIKEKISRSNKWLINQL